MFPSKKCMVYQNTYHENMCVESCASLFDRCQVILKPASERTIISMYSCLVDTRVSSTDIHGLSISSMKLMQHTRHEAFLSRARAALTNVNDFWVSCKSKSVNVFEKVRSRRYEKFRRCCPDNVQIRINYRNVHENKLLCRRREIDSRKDGCESCGKCVLR
jgi:hypothetical protein